jgi:phage-related protein
MADLTISISLDASGLTSGIQRAKSEMESLARTNLAALGGQLKNIGESIQAAGAKITGFGQSLTSSLTGPLVSLAQMGLGFSAMRERAELSFSVLLDSGEKAKALMADLTSFADSTPFESQEIIDAGKKLVSFGVDAGEVKNILTDLGDTAATMEVNITDVASAFGRLKAGDFGEAFERFRDFGISREMLEGQGLKFDKSGQFKGSVDEAMNAVRAVMKDKFGGTMDKLSDSVSGKLATLGDKAKGLLVKLFEPVQPALTQSLDYLIKVVENVITWFENAPAGVKVFILALGGLAAAIGPVLVVLGTVLTAVGAFISAIGAIAAGGTASVVIAAIAAAIGLLAAGIGIAIGVVFALKEAWDNGFGPIASVVAIAVGLILTAISPILGLPILIGAVAMTIYEMWATNFGGLQEFTAVVWAKIQEYFNIAMTAIKQLVADIGGDVIAWWTENYPLIQQTVQTVSDAMRAYIQNFLNAVKAFWDLHGEQIMSVVKSIWTIISTVVRTGVNVILGVVRMVMQIINGDWAGAWNTALSIVQKINSAIWRVLGELGNIVVKALAFVVTEIVSLATRVGAQAAKIGENIVNGIINGISGLADRLKNYARSLITSMFGVMNSAAETHSPSQVTTRMGMFIGQGLVAGLNNAAPLVNKAAKKMVDSSLGNMGKDAKKAVKEFQDMAASTAQQRQDVVTVAQFGQGKSNLDELIKLRAELNQNVSNALPNTLAGVNAELKELGQQKQGIKDAADMLAQFDEQIDKIKNKDVRKSNVDRANELLSDPVRVRGITDGGVELRKKAGEADELNRVEAIRAAREKMTASVAGGNQQLANEIALLEAKKAKNFEMTAAEQQAFQQNLKNAEELAKFREGLEKDGLNKSDIDGLVEEMQRQQEAVEKLKASKASLEAQDKLYTDTMGGMNATLAELNQKLAGNTQLTEADTLAKIKLTEAYRLLTDEEKKNLDEKAKEVAKKREQVEELEKAKKQMDEFKGFIKDSLNTLVNDGFGAMFKSIFNKFKKMLIDMAIEWISSKLYKLIFKDGQASGTGSGGGLGGILQSVLGLFGGKGSGASGSDGGGGGDGAKVGSFGGLFDPIKPIFGGKNAAPSQLAGTMSGIGALAALAGSVIGGRVGGIISMAGTGMSIGAMFGGPIGAAVGAGIGALVGIFMGDPKKKVDKKENMPKLQKGFTDAMQQLRDLMNDRNALFGDPEGAVAKAMEIRGAIASGFGIEFQSKKYKKEAAKLIATKLVEADQLIKQIKEMADMARAANSVNTRLEAEFATGVFADRAFIRQHTDFKRRNGLLAGGWTGRDTLPSMLASGEMVLNPKQIDRVKSNAGFDAFRGAGIPNYAAGTFVGPTSAAPAGNAPAQPVTVQIVLNNSGIVESDIKGVLVNGLKQSDVQVELVKAYDKGKSRVRG